MEIVFEEPTKDWVDSFVLTDDSLTDFVLTAMETQLDVVHDMESLLVVPPDLVPEETCPPSHGMRLPLLGTAWGLIGVAHNLARVGAGETELGDTASYVSATRGGSGGVIVGWRGGGRVLNEFSCSDYEFRSSVVRFVTRSERVVRTRFPDIATEPPMARFLSELKTAAREVSEGD